MVGFIILVTVVLLISGFLEIVTLNSFDGGFLPCKNVFLICQQITMSI